MLLEIQARLRALPGVPSPHARHDERVALLIRAGELWQGLADAESAGEDARSPAQDAAAALAVALAREVWRSWRGDGDGPASLPPLAAAGAWERLALPERIQVKRPEGYAFYSVFPECYAAAAAAAVARLPAGPERLQVAGIRSLGTSAAAMVRAGAGAGPLPFSVRPRGHPFDRTLALAEGLRAELRAGAAGGGCLAVADEGPGLSGSSFASVAEAWAAAGGTPDRLHLFPSHAGGPGPMAPERARRRWAESPRHLVDFDALVRPRIAAWLGGGDLADLSAGAWRHRLYPDRGRWPAAIPWQERRKYLARTASGVVLARFAGLGDLGRRALERARALAGAGFIPEVLELRHGFLAQRWVDAAPLDGGGAQRVSRAELVAHLGRYLGFRARALRAGPDQPGASLAALSAMARQNAGLELPPPPSSAGGPRVAVDGRLQPSRWLVDTAGRIWKADAVDHCEGHDLVGCQPLAWDVASAVVELDLTGEEAGRLLEGVRAAAGVELGPAALPFFTRCYLAFQIGRARLGAESVDAEERARLLAAAARYERRLE
jgi:hypothetical protein